MGALSKEQRRFLERATLQYASHLDEAQGVLEARGLEMGLARSSALGVVRDPLPGHEHHTGKLVIPYLTDAGPVNLTFRCLRDHGHEGHGKYVREKGLPGNLYNVQAIAYAEEWIVVTEGELDALIMKQIGIPALAVPGVEHWKEHWPNVFEDFSRVYLFEDGDSAGEKLWNKMSYELSNVIRVKMPDGEDVNSMFVKSGAEYLINRIKK